MVLAYEFHNRIHGGGNAAPTLREPTCKKKGLIGPSNANTHTGISTGANTNTSTDTISTQPHTNTNGCANTIANVNIEIVILNHPFTVKLAFPF